MFSIPPFMCALRFFSGAGLAVFLALAILTAHSYIAGGYVPAMILGAFFWLSCPWVLALSALGAGMLFKAGLRSSSLFCRIFLTRTGIHFA